MNTKEKTGERSEERALLSTLMKEMQTRKCDCELLWILREYKRASVYFVHNINKKALHYIKLLVG